MADSNSISNFPRAYVNSVRENDPVVMRVDQDKSEIGARSSGMPKTMIDGNLSLEHVNNRSI